MYALKYRHTVKIIKLLIKKTNINNKDQNGNFTLITALKNIYTENIIKLLINIELK